MASLKSVEKWDFEADVVIVGFGMAGAAAAIEARDADPSAEIIILEKMPPDKAGGNARVSGQSLLIARDAVKLAAYQRRMSAANPIPEDLLTAWAAQMVALEPWIKARAEEAGLRYAIGSGWSESGDAVLEFPEYGAAEAIAHQSTILPTPSGVWMAVKACVDRRGITVLYSAPAVDLVQDPDTLEVRGVVIDHLGERRSVAARRGVIMCCGGYENNPRMQRDYFGLGEVYPLGTPGNTGDGIRILQKAGADLWHMRNRGQSGGIWPGFAVEGFSGAFLRNSLYTAFSWIDLGADDCRFYDETAPHHRTHYKYKVHGAWVDIPIHAAQPVHMIFDETTRAGMCLATRFMTWNTVVEGYRWSDDNRAEVDRGWILQAQTIDELARKLGRDPARVSASVDTYNSACVAGSDREFERAPATLRPLVQPPFYAMKIVPTIVCTSGGARRNSESQVLDPAGNAIPRLFEAGELGSIISDLYQNGSYLTEAMISGRIAGRNAVSLRSQIDDIAMKGNA